MGQSVIARVVRVASGRFAPGHLGELTRQVPFEMVDAVLAETRAVQARVRDLPSRVVVYLLLAGCLFAEVGYGQVWQRLVAGLPGLDVARPSAAALTQARRRVGVAPLRALFEVVRGPVAVSAGTGGVRWRGLLVCAIDGTTMAVPDTTANLAVFAKQAGHNGYPLLRLLALVCCGSRSVIDAVFGSDRRGETTYVTGLLTCLRPGMIVLADRNFAAGTVLAGIAETGAHLLVRARTGRGGPKLPVLHRLGDGSYLSRFGGRQVRVIDAQITVATRAGHHTGVYRLITTLLDAGRYPAFEVVALYHERWEIETAYLELKASTLGGRVLRARTPAGVAQEMYALLVTYQILRTAMADATNSADIDPDRASFTTALNTARDQVVQAAGVIADTVIDTVGTIGRVVLDNLLPPRRLRLNARTVKRAISKYNARGPNIDRRTHPVTLTINIITGPALTTGPEP